ncbi:MAG: hypothetical protein AAB819_00420 [Patescibacteria group bacterium]
MKTSRYNFFFSCVRLASVISLAFFILLTPLVSIAATWKCTKAGVLGSGYYCSTDDPEAPPPGSGCTASQYGQGKPTGYAGCASDYSSKSAVGSDEESAPSPASTPSGTTGSPASVKTTGSGSYELLEPIGGIKIISGDPAAYYVLLYQIGVGIAGLLAVIMIAIGGVEYIASAANPNLKEAAKTRITMALIGLLLALGSYLILNTINPRAAQFELALPASPGDLAPSAEEAARAEEIKGQWDEKGIGSKPLCDYGTAIDCNGYNLPDEAVDGVTAIKEACSAKDVKCNVFVSGGSETHEGTTAEGLKNGTQHGEGQAVVDLRKDPGLDGYLAKQGVKKDGKEYETKDGTRYLYEPKGVGNSTGDHWHVVFPKNRYK